MTSPLPGTPPPSPGSLTPGEPARELEWRLCLRQLAALHEADRHTAARALHNQIGQAVSAIKMSAHLTLDEADPSQRREDLLEIIRIADDTVAQLRDLHALLHPPQLEGLGLEASLRGESERGALTPPAGVALDIEALPQRPAAEIELACFRIVQQLLRRATATSSQARIFLQLRDEGEGLRVRLECDQPIPDAPLLRTWATALQGDLRIDSLAGAGTRFELHLPYMLPEMPAEPAAPARASRY